MRKKIKVELSPEGVKKAIKELRDYKKWLIERTYEFVKELGNEGVQIMSVKFAHAIYDGTNDVKCKVREEGKDKVAVMAVGSATLFIEFGTGVRYPDNHPDAHENGMIRGQYGHGLGKLPQWRYRGEAGTNGVPIVGGRHEGEILTRGNPANMCMYKTVQELQDKFEEIARRVFI